MLPFLTTGGSVSDKGPFVKALHKSWRILMLFLDPLVFPLHILTLSSFGGARISSGKPDDMEN